MEAAGCFWCVNMLKSGLSNFSCVNDSKHPWIALAEFAVNVSAERSPKKVARLCRTLLNSNRGIQCTQKLHVHADFYTQKSYSKIR